MTAKPARFILFLLLMCQSAMAVKVLLPNGDVAKNMKFQLTQVEKVTKKGKSVWATTELTTDGKGDFQPPKALANVWGNAVILDFAGYAIHIQCWVAFDSIQLVTDEGFDGILVDEKGDALVDKDICIGSQVGIIWGQIYVPAGLNRVKTNDKGEFKMRQMVLNDVKSYQCSAGIVYFSEKLTSPENFYEYTFSGPEYKKPAKGVKVVMR